MLLSEDKIKHVISLISSKLGPDATAEEVKNLASEVVRRLSTASPADGQEVMANVPGIRKTSTPLLDKKLILSAVGNDEDGLEEKIRLFVARTEMRLLDMKEITADSFRCVLAIIDYSDYRADINDLKFKLCSLCEECGYKAIIQDSSYYGIGARS
jgi:predicted amino acid-binding ACT domain protein